MKDIIHRVVVVVIEVAIVSRSVVVVVVVVVVVGTAYQALFPSVSTGVAHNFYF